MRISEAAVKFSLPRHYIHYWRKIGLLSSGGGELEFQDLLKVRFILDCKRRGISLQKIRQALHTLPLEEVQEGGAWVNRHNSRQCCNLDELINQSEPTRDLASA